MKPIKPFNINTDGPWPGDQRPLRICFDCGKQLIETYDYDYRNHDHKWRGEVHLESDCIEYLKNRLDTIEEFLQILGYSSPSII
jgi:hypothetical protein